jgi:branched-chain amino acid aminotransferase
MSSSHVANPNAHARYLWREGKLVPWESAQIHVTSVGHASVASVFEGLKAYWSEAGGQLNCFRLQEHMERLVSSARLARIRCDWSVEGMCEAILALLRANETREDTYIRPWLFASGLIRNHMVPANAPTELVIDTWPFLTCGPDNSCRAGITSWTRISELSMPPRIKAFSNYSNGRLGMIEAEANGYDCPIFLNEAGMVTESAGACIAVAKKGTVYTPPLSAGILDSFTRATLMTILPELGIPVREAELTRTDLYTADEAFFMGTGWEVLPIREVDGMVYPIGAPGPITRRMAAEYFRIVRGESPNHSDWLTPVWDLSADVQASESETIQVS